MKNTRWTKTKLQEMAAAVRRAQSVDEILTIDPGRHKVYCAADFKLGDGVALASGHDGVVVAIDLENNTVTAEANSQTMCLDPIDVRYRFELP